MVKIKFPITIKVYSLMVFLFIFIISTPPDIYKQYNSNSLYQKNILFQCLNSFEQRGEEVLKN
jgi:hypothetical protein